MPNSIKVAVLLALLIFIYCVICPNFSPPLTINGNPIPNVLIVDACTLDESKCLKDVLLIRGQIVEDTDEYVKEVLKAHPTDTICFSSEGGNTDTSIRIGKLIDSKGLNTCLAKRYKLNGGKDLALKACESACPYMFLTGTNRVALGEDFRIGVHSSGWHIDCCILKFKFTDNEKSMMKYKNMFLAKRSKDDSKHIALIDLASNEEYSGMDYLERWELEHYAFFTERFLENTYTSK